MPRARPHDRRALALALREARARRTLTQEALADRAGLGRNFVHKVERGTENPRFESLVWYAEALDVPLSELIEGYERRLSD